MLSSCESQLLQRNWTSSLHYQECLLPNDQQICGNFLPKAQRKFMWLKLLATLCWTVCLTDWTTRNKVSYFSTHSWLVQNFTSTANTSSNANVTTVELSWHVLSKWKCTSCFPRKLDPATLSTRSAYHNTVGQQGGIFSCLATLA